MSGQEASSWWERSAADCQVNVSTASDQGKLTTVTSYIYGLLVVALNLHTLVPVMVTMILNKSWRDSVDHSQWNIRRSTEGELTRQERTTLAQTRTGHCTLLKAYRNRIGLKDDGTCEMCKREEDREHLLGRCPTWSQERRETFGEPFLSHGELITAEPAVDWPASGHRQCIAGGATQQQQQQWYCVGIASTGWE